MNQPIKNPHTFDMSNYLMGLTYELGGKDLEQDEKKAEEVRKDSSSETYKLDWSFLKKNLKPSKRIY
jgi:hypothetical protein